MASTYSTSLKLQLMGNGEDSGTWGSITNTNWNLAEQAISGVQTITMGNANYTLSNLNGVSDEARNMVLVVGGTNSGIYQIIAPLAPKFYVVSNQTVGGYAITIGGASGSIVTVPNGTTVQVYCDGTSFFSAQTSSAGNFNVNGNLSVSGNETVTGTLGVTGAISGTTATFSGAISSVSPSFTGVPTAPTASAGTSTTQIATTAFVAQNAVLTGALLMWPTVSAPSGYLLCDGSAVSRTTYAALFAVIGTTFGAGDTTTTFNLPNYVNRMPIGVGSTAALAATGGSADAIVVSHTHTASVSDPGHSHTVSGVMAAADRNYTTFGGEAGTYTSRGTSGATTGISVTNSTTGSSGTNANLPPYLGINFIIKT
jgi:microcystin-dependent protein